MNDSERIATIGERFRAFHYPEPAIAAITSYLAGRGTLANIPTDNRPIALERFELNAEGYLFLNYNALRGLVCPRGGTLDALDRRLLDVCFHTWNLVVFLGSLPDNETGPLEQAYADLSKQSRPLEQIHAELPERGDNPYMVVEWLLKLSKTIAFREARPATHIDRLLLTYGLSTEQNTAEYARRDEELSNYLGHGPRNFEKILWFAHLLLTANPPLLDRAWRLLLPRLENAALATRAARLLLEHRPDLFFEQVRPYLQKHIAAGVGGWEGMFELLMDYEWEGRLPYGASLLAHRTQQVRNTAAEWLSGQRSAVIPEVAPLLTHRSDTTRVAATHVLLGIESNDARALLIQHLADERSAAVRHAILQNLGFPWAAASDHDQDNPQPFIAALTEEATAQTTKKQGKPPLPWFDAQHAPPLHWRTGDPVAPEVITYLFALQAQTSEPGPARHLRQVAARLEPRPAGTWALALWQGWLGSGAAAKTAWCLALVGAFGDDRLVQPMRAQIDTWSKGARGAVAARVVGSLALVGSDLALATVDDIALRARHKQVAAAAQEALVSAARDLGITQDELSDRIVPDLGFDARGEQVLDYGPRQFTARLHQDGTLRCTDAAGKVRTSPPKPGKSDDPDKAAAAQDQWKLLKKQVKQVMQMQRQRLEQALIAQRAWDMPTWTKLFLHHPLLRPLAIGLVWGLRAPDVEGCTVLFRPLEDGTLTDADDEPVTLPDRGQVRMVHPLELDAETCTTWLEHLADYELVPPFAQFNRPVVLVPPEQHALLWYGDYAGYIMNGGALKGRYQKASWQRGSVQDAGCYGFIWKGFPGAGIEAVLEVAGMCVGYEQKLTAGIGKLGFVRSETIERGSYVYDDPVETDPRLLKLGDVPPIVFSETVANVQSFAATGQYDAEWKKKIG